MPKSGRLLIEEALVNSYEVVEVVNVLPYTKEAMTLVLEVLFILVDYFLKKIAKETIDKPALFRW